MEGTLTKLSVGGGILANWRQRFFVLEGPELFWYESEAKRHGPAKGSLRIPGKVVGVIHSSRAHFCVNDRQATQANQRLLELRAASADDMRRWIEALSKASVELDSLPVEPAPL